MGQRVTASPPTSRFPPSVLPGLSALLFWDLRLSHPPPVAAWKMHSGGKETVSEGHCRA